MEKLVRVIIVAKPKEREILGKGHYKQPKESVYLTQRRILSKQTLLKLDFLVLIRQ